MVNPTPNYKTEDWNNYAHCHAQVTTFLQHEVYSACSELLKGNVLDIGCATGKLISYITNNYQITNYTGLDISKTMVESTKTTISLFGQSNFTAVCDDIETYQVKNYDCAVSIMSYYSWKNPKPKLKNIYSLLNDNGFFILATANPKLDINRLLEHSKRELIRHPFWHTFKKHNESLADNDSARFITMSELVKECQSVGFTLEYCHQKFYLGGMNFLLLSK